MRPSSLLDPQWLTPAMPLRVILVATAPFWVYLTLSNLFLYESYMLGMSERVGIAHPLARIAQHLLLYPLVVVCYRWAWRAGLPERRRGLTLLFQLALAFMFAMFGRLALNVGLVVSAPLLMDQASLHEWLSSEVLQFMTLPPGDLARMWLISDFALWQRATTEFFLVYWFGLALIIGLRIYLELRDEKLRAARLREEWLEARLDALAGQLNPHFLFNSLNTVSAFVRQEPERAERLIADLSQLLRASLRQHERPYASVADELEFVARYLDIERTRFEDRLHTEVNAPQGILNAQIPSLLLQPLIENAIKHGVSRARGEARIALAITQEGDHLRITVRNTYRPREGSVPPDGAQVGLRNVRERLATLYGAAHGFNSHQVGDEWEVSVTVPFVDRGREGKA